VLLAGLAIVLMALSLVAAVSTLILGIQTASTGGLPYVGIVLLAGALCVLAYGLNRRGHYWPAALLVVGTVVAAVWTSLLTLPPSPDNNLIILAYLAVPLLVSGLLLPLWPTLAIAAGNVVVLLALAVLKPGAFIYLAIMSALTCAMTVLREHQMNEIERRNRELAESVAQFQSAFEYAAIGMALVALDGRWLRANRSLCTLLGYSEAELRAIDFQAITHPDDLAADLGHIRRLLTGEVASYQLEKRYYHKQGQLVWTSLSVSLVHTAAGAPLHFVSQIQDISERKQVEDALRASEARFRTLSNASPIGVYETDAQGRDLYHNAHWQALTGLSDEDMQGAGWLQAVHPEDREQVMADWERCLREEQPFVQEYRFLDAAGRVRWAQSHAAAIRSGTGEVAGYVGTVGDITELKTGAHALQAANERMASWVSELEQNSRDIGLLNELTNLLQSCFTAEEAYNILQQIGPQLFPQQAGLLGVTNASRNLVETMAAWGDGAVPTPAAFLPDDCWALRRGRPHWYEAGSGTVRCAHVDPAVPPSCLCLPMMAHGEGMGVLHLQAAAPDGPPLTAARRSFAQTVADSVSLALANLKLRERLRDQAIRDPLTGLFNRRYLEETLDRELGRAERDEQPVGVLMLDIDYFKRFNDSFGHAAGDEVLRALGRVLGQQVRVEDIACRYGGEEFTLVLPGCSLEAACQRAEQLRQQARDLHLVHAGQPVGGITISVGVAVSPQHGLTDGPLLRAADAALYQAKQAGRNQVVAAAMPGYGFLKGT
jgi:diguanylate cyclase (GGDEF)-like protein/PAS domain S-box-containing protein